MSNNRLTRREFIHGAGLSSIGLVLAACSQSTASTPEPTSAPAAVATMAPITSPTATPLSGPRYGGVLRIGILTDALSVGSPPDLRSYPDYLMSFQCIESLGRFDASGQMVPWLATGWTADPAAKNLTVMLKEGVKFHDGTDFNAEACKWNLENFLASQRPEFAGVASIDIVDDHTVRINLEVWDNTSLTGLGYYAGPMISPTAFEANGKEWAMINPVGTGPFKFVSWERDVKQVYERFDGYWQEGKPYLDGVEWHIFADPLTAVASFKAKEIDAIASIPPQMASELEASGATILQLNTGLGSLIQGVIGDSAHPDSPFANVKVRQALGHAIDNEALVESLLLGFGTPVNQWGVPSAWSYNPDAKGYPYDPAKAKELLAEAGYPEGFDTHLLTGNDPLGMQVGTAVQGYLAEVGINAELEAADFGKFGEHVMVSGWTGLIMWASRSDADIGITMPRNLSSQGTHYANSIAHPEEIDALLTELRTAPDFESQKALAHELQKVVFDDYAMITPIAVSTILVAKYPEVKDDGFNLTHATSWTPEDAWKET